MYDTMHAYSTCLVHNMSFNEFLGVFFRPPNLTIFKNFEISVFVSVLNNMSCT